jgi:hypothetical protein
MVSMACGKQQPINSSVETAGLTAGSCKEITEADRERLISNILKINVGDTRAVVESIVGVPASSESLRTKKGDRTVATMSYYFVKRCGGVGRIRNDDTYVRFLFHLDGRLSSIEAFGVDGVAHRSDVPPPGKEN